MTTHRTTPGHVEGSAVLGLSSPGGIVRAPLVRSHSLPVHAARPVVLPALTGAPSPDIRLRIQRLVVLFVIDDSGSMYGSWGDQAGVRYAAAQSVLGLMVRAGGGRAGGQHWGTTSPEELSLAPIEVKRGRKKLRSFLTVPPTLGGNDLPLALRTTLRLVPTLRADEQLLTVVFTDGIEEVTSATHSAVAAYPDGAVHMVLVDRSGGCTPAMEAQWRSVPFGSFTRLRSFDTTVMAHQLGDLIAHATGLQMPAPRIRKQPTTTTTERTTT